MTMTVSAFTQGSQEKFPFQGEAHGFQTVMLCVYGELHIEKARRQLDVQRAQKVRSGQRILSKQMVIGALCVVEIAKEVQIGERKRLGTES